MSDSSWSFYFESQYDDRLNDTEEVGKVLVTNVTICHFRQYSFFILCIARTTEG